LKTQNFKGKFAILKAKLRFCQTLNCVFKNHFFEIAHFKIVILNRTFWNRKPKWTLYSFIKTINSFDLLNIDFWFIHEIFYRRINAKVLPLNSLHFYTWVTDFIVIVILVLVKIKRKKTYHMYIVCWYLILKCPGQRLKIPSNP
jgi:hypothetical protein